MPRRMRRSLAAAPKVSAAEVLSVQLCMHTRVHAQLPRFHDLMGDDAVEACPWSACFHMQMLHEMRQNGL